MIFPVVLSGGSGSRLWPLSRTLLPKQFLPLVSDKTMLQETLLRLNGLSGLKNPILVCSNDHRFLAAEQLREINTTAGAQILVSAPSATSPGVDFGPVEVSEPSAVETLTVTNDGAQTLEFEAAASLSGPNAADFAIVADGCETAVLAFGESCTVEVQVEPSALGARSASVQLPNNSATGLQEFALEAEGV